MQQIFSNFDCALLTSILGGGMIVAWRLGLWIGRKDREAGGQAHISKFDDASLALLGLLLAFSFATSFSKYDQRRLMVVADSNSIGDFYNSASLLNEPVRGKLRNLIREYVELRIQIARNPGDRVRFEQTLQRFEQMHVQMVELVEQGLRDDTPIAVPLTNTLNALTSNFAARLAAFNDRLPDGVVVLLFASAILSTMLIGRQQGVLDTLEFAGTLTFILLVCLTVYVTLDLNQPQRGFIRASQEPIERLLLPMKQ
jgi:hypothetical protein